MTGSLAGKTLFITGGSRGIGKAIALRAARDGARIVIAAKTDEPHPKLPGTIHTAAQEIEAAGGEALAVACDIRFEDQVLRAVERAVATFGGIDILVNNAGIATAVPASRETPEQFRQVIDINLNGSYWMAQACGRVMLPGSSIINISSVLGFTTLGLPQAAYAASKAALIGLTRDLAQQWTSRKGIRVNALAPGFFLSEMTEQYPEGYIESQMPRVLAGRPGDPAELAATAVFLASDAAGYITGTTLPVDGGMLTN